MNIKFYYKPFAHADIKGNLNINGPDPIRITISAEDGVKTNLEFSNTAKNLSTASKIKDSEKDISDPILGLSHNTLRLSHNSLRFSHTGKRLSAIATTTGTFIIGLGLTVLVKSGAHKITGVDWVVNQKTLENQRPRM